MSTVTHADFLIAAPTRWDEACFSVPAVRALAASGLRVGVACVRPQQLFWESLPEVEVICYSAGASARLIAREISGDWKASLAWDASPTADAFMRLAIPRRLGPPSKQLRKRLTHPVSPKPSKGPLEHRVRHYLALVSELGIDVAKPQFFAPAALGITAEPSTVLICPDSDYGPSHEWPLDRWIALARAIEASGLKTTITGLPNGRSLGLELNQALGPDSVFFDADPLPAALPVLAVHQTVIAADGSLPHLAAHAGASCITLFGPNDPSWKRPLGRQHRVIRHHTECAPCLLPKCPLDHRCQQQLTLERILTLLNLKNPLAPAPKIRETTAPA